MTFSQVRTPCSPARRPGSSQVTSCHWLLLGHSPNWTTDRHPWGRTSDSALIPRVLGLTASSTAHIALGNVLGERGVGKQGKTKNPLPSPPVKREPSRQEVRSLAGYKKHRFMASFNTMQHQQWGPVMLRNFFPAHLKSLWLFCSLSWQIIIVLGFKCYETKNVEV